MILSIDVIENKKVLGFYDKAMQELIEFYKFNWHTNTPKIQLFSSRKALDAIWNTKTEDYVVGGGGKEVIHLLSPEAVDKESVHDYSDKFYFELMKHELSHSFYDLIIGERLPVWFDEGLAMYISGQEYDECIKIEYCLDYFDKHSKYQVNEAPSVIAVLIEEYGKDRFIKFIHKLKGVNTEEAFSKLFGEYFGIELGYREINKLISKNK